jgi:hypothetical protein
MAWLRTKQKLPRHIFHSYYYIQYIISIDIYIYNTYIYILYMIYVFFLSPQCHMDDPCKNLQVLKLQSSSCDVLIATPPEANFTMFHASFPTLPGSWPPLTLLCLKQGMLFTFGWRFCPRSRLSDCKRFVKTGTRMHKEYK